MAELRDRTVLPTPAVRRFASDSPDVSRGWVVLGLAVVLLLLLGRIGGFGLIDPDEGRYAEIPREMIESGDWITPRLNYVDYFEKPPLLYWLTGLSIRTFGATEGAARLIPALSGLATVVLAYLLGLRMFRRRSALLGAAILVTSPLFFAFSQALVIDMLLTACMTATLAAAWVAHRSERKSGWALASSVACALAVLAKGPVGLVLPGMIILAYLSVVKDYVTLRALVSWKPVALFLVIAVPWFALVTARNPGFAEFFFVREHLQRFGGDIGHPEGPLYYLPVLFVGGLPWTAVFVALPFDRASRAEVVILPRQPRLFLLLWASVVLAFFTVASSKLAGYILPALPPLALLGGTWLDGALAHCVSARTVMERTFGALAVLGAVVTILAGVAWAGAAPLAAAVRIDVAGVRSACQGLAFAGLALVGVWFTKRVIGARWPARVPIPVWMVAALVLASFVAAGGRDAAPSSNEIGRVAAAVVPPGGRLVSYRELRQGLPFYFGGRVIQVEYEGELAFGAERAPDRADYFWKDEDFAREARRGEDLWIVAREGRVDELRERLGDELAVLKRSDGLALLECLRCGKEP